MRKTIRWPLIQARLRFYQRAKFCQPECAHIACSALQGMRGLVQRVCIVRIVRRLQGTEAQRGVTQIHGNDAARHAEVCVVVFFEFF